ncbi:MAG: glucosamine inositolphosphorylceramide transferase family protein [Nostoc sp. ChiQUE02]|uniref:glucosamine inositolphosphorylceramide transferase family protein n=1 Tax=Nostoc sp. ChiQUE02 TaxID=3075377 RepID=UPI002AD537DA|nr:hypothetical protein [Nostoc sp. ChiQUE02]MDZ8230579.1 hypothetical protein [Nostoc sp. ChiQUE02]
MKLMHKTRNLPQVLDRGSARKSGYFSFKRMARAFVRRTCDWSIGIYTGESLFDFVSTENIKNPVLTAKDVTDVIAEFVADPFMVCNDGIWYMFFEVMNSLTNRGEIGLATSNNGFHWNYQQIVMKEPFHLSYPYVFQFQNEYYMIPESYKANSIRLYKAVDFPTKWTFLKTLIDDGDYVDTSVFNFNKRWWMFTSSSQSNILRLYYAHDLMGHWIEHPQSPLIENNLNIARPGGRVVFYDGQIFRYTQDDEHFYGNQVRAFEITDLTTTTYEEKAVKDNPIIKASGYGWNKTGMHTIDPHKLDSGKWIACVDGYQLIVVFSIKLQNWMRLITKANATT